MKVLFDISVINIEYLKKVMDFIKTLKHKEKNLSQIKFLKEKEIHVYNIWQTSFTQPMVKTYFNTERECLYTGASFEVAYRDSKPIEFKCFKMGE